MKQLPAVPSPFPGWKVCSHSEGDRRSSTLCDLFINFEFVSEKRHHCFKRDTVLRKKGLSWTENVVITIFLFKTKNFISNVPPKSQDVYLELCITIRMAHCLFPSVMKWNTAPAAAQPPGRLFTLRNHTGLWGWTFLRMCIDSRIHLLVFIQEIYFMPLNFTYIFDFWF